MIIRQSLLIFCLLFINQVEAHYCELPTPCKKYWEATAVFTGTVKKAVTHRAKNHIYHTVTVEIEQAFRGDVQKGQLLELIDSSEYRSSSHFELNKQYFIYAIGSYTEPGRYAAIQVCTKNRPCEDKKSNKYYAGLSLCSATKPLNFANDDLEYAKLVQQDKAGKIFGRIINNGYLSGVANRTVNSMVREMIAQQDNKDELAKPINPAANQVIIVTDNQDNHYQTQSDENGWFSINKLPTARYTLNIDLDGKFHPSQKHNINLNKASCVDMNLAIYSSNFAQIRGRLLNHAKEPEVDSLLFLIPIEKNIDLSVNDLDKFESSYTNNKGQFWFPATTAGKYYLLRFADQNSDNHSNHTIDYFKESNAYGKDQVIEVSAGQRLTLDDFQLP